MTMTTLWQPDLGSVRTSRTQNEFVRRLYWNEKTSVVGWKHPMGCKCRPLCGQFRGDLARDWVATVHRAELTTDVHLKMPGADARQPLRPGETQEYRRVDAARTRIRQFEAGQDQAEWVLVGLETTIAERHGLPYPAGAYDSQRRLFV